MCIAWHQHVFVLFALLDEFVEQHFYAISYLHQFVTGKQLQVYQHLIVTTAARMDFLAHIAQFAREHQFHLRMHVLDTILDLELTAFANLIDVLQLG